MPTFGTVWSIVDHNLHTLLTIGDVAERTGARARHAARMGTAARLSRPGPVAERPPAIHRTTGRPDPRRASSTASRVFAPRGDFPRVGHAAEQRIALRCRGVRQLAPPAASVTTGNARLEPFDRRCQCVRRWTTTGGRQLSTSPHLRRMRTTLARVGSRCRRRARIRRLRRGGSPRVARRDPDRACVTASPGVGRRDRWENRLRHVSSAGSGPPANQTSKQFGASREWSWPRPYNAPSTSLGRGIQTSNSPMP